MNWIWSIAGIIVVAGAISSFLVGRLVQLAPQIGLLDRPNERSSHLRVTPRGGGVGLVAGVLIVMVGLFFFGLLSWSWSWEIYFLAAGGVSLISLRDDFRSLNAGVRFACHFAAALFALIFISAFHEVTLPGLGSYSMKTSGVALTLLWVVGLTNVYNFMDGIDGIAGVQGVIAGLAWTVAGIFCNSHATSFLGSTVAGVCAGFLIHNWAPAKIFMGDVGSAFLGFTFGVLPLVALRALQDSAAAFQIGNLPLFAILVLWPFIGDSSLTFFRRLLKGEPVWQAHRSHLYQRLAQTGWSHARICIVYGVWAAFSAGVGLWFLTNGSGNIWLVAGFPFGSLAAVFTLTTLREKKSLRQAP